METNESYPLEVTNAINAFVDRIEQVLLQNGTPRAERTSVCAEVETQIHMMIERRLEAGGTLNLESVQGIIESMDPPESYAKPVELSHTGDSKPAPVAPPSADSSERRTKLDDVKNWMRRTARTTPALDWLAIVGLAATSFGLLFVLAGLASRSEFALVSGFFWSFAGVLASGISFWRIRHSNGLLTGHRMALAGVLALPIAIANGIACTLLIATPLGAVLAMVGLATALVYGNYLSIRYAFRCLDSYSAAMAQSMTQESDPIPKPDQNAGQRMAPA
jgi:hypothetical protein